MKRESGSLMIGCETDLLDPEERSIPSTCFCSCTVRFSVVFRIAISFSQKPFSLEVIEKCRDESNDILSIRIGPGLWDIWIFVDWTWLISAVRSNYSHQRWRGNGTYR